ncbi:MAG: cation diffusion facilitator family transporter [Bilifractor sp.]|nr:cation diffusion facilitator family transporter [Lachnospiraceae bacterium]MDY2837050.1 cation diffusion facilitator family transporter [Bilifractor sp.]
MTELLIRKFIKDYQKTDDVRVRTAYGTLAGIVGIFCNFFLFGVKISVGLFMMSMAVIADAFNNLSDAVSSIISLIAMRMAGKPADKDHPFGHGRMEYIAALIISVLIIVVGVEFFRSSLDKIRNPEGLHFSLIAIVLLIVSIGVKLWMFFFNRCIGKRIGSEVMRATAMDSFFDAVTTTMTLVSIGIYFVFDINIDGFAGLLVSFVVIYAGIGIARDTVKPLLGEAMDPELADKIEKIVLGIQGVAGAHDLIIHSYGPNRYLATIHVEVSKQRSLEEGHNIADEAEKKVLDSLGVVLVAHVDPVELHDSRVLKIREEVARILHILDEELSFHDFRVSFQGEKTLISFDLVVPYSYSEEQEHKTARQIDSLLREMNPDYSCSIVIDRGILEEKPQ